MMRTLLLRHRIVAPATILAALLAAATPAQAVPVHRRLDPSISTRIRAATGHEPFAMFAAHARGGLAAGMERFFDERPDELNPAFAAAAVCGLWSADTDVAFGAACHVEERQLDLADIDRYLDIVAPHLLGESLRFDFYTFRHVVDTRRLGALLDVPPPPGAAIRFFYLGTLHRSLRPSQVPKLCELARCRDPIVRREAFHVLGAVSTLSPADPVSLLRLLQEWPGEVAVRVVDPDDLDANPAFIARAVAIPIDSGYGSIAPLLDRWFRPDATPMREELAFAPFLARRVAQGSPGVSDIDRVDAALRQDVRVIRLGVLASLANATDIGPFRSVLDAFVRRTDPPDVEIAWAHRLLGDVETLRARAVDEPAFLLVALQADHDAVWRDWTARAFGDDAAVSGAAIQMLAEAAEFAPFAPAPFPDHARRRLREAVETGADALDLERIETLVAEFPTVRSPALVRRALERIETTDEPLGALDFDGRVVAVGKATAAMLEVADAARLTAALQQRIARTGGADGDRWILGLLGPTAGNADEWLAWADEQGGLLEIRWTPGTPFGRRFADAVAARLRDRSYADADPTAFASFAAAHGLPSSVAREWIGQLEALPDRALADGWPRWRDAVLAGRPVDALVDCLDSAGDALPSRWVHGLGEVRDERIVDRLRRWRFTPGELVQDLILELAVAGDPDARAEFDAVLRRHLYGWIDDAADDRRVLVDDLALLPYWIDELGTICCRRNGAMGAIESLVEFEAGYHIENLLVTQRDAAHAWHLRVKDRLRWSEILGRYTVMPD